MIGLKSLPLTLTHVGLEPPRLGRLPSLVTSTCSLTTTAMASVEGIPACLLVAPTVTQPSHLEGDPSLATEILPGPPPLSAVQQAGQPKKDHKKVPIVVSYLPTSDPGTTYGANTVSTMAPATEVDGPRRKRARLEKGYVVLILSHPSHADPQMLSLPIRCLVVALPNYRRRFPMLSLVHAACAP